MKILAFILFIILLPMPQTSRTTLTISPRTVLSTISRQSIGVNTNYLMDGATNTTAGIAALNVGSLRYPGAMESSRASVVR